MKRRGRPKKYRIVRLDPRISQFSPRGKPGRPDEIDLAMDEFEAIRLADLMGLDQQKAAVSMHISQQTFSRILKRAHRAHCAWQDHQDSRRPLRNQFPLRW